MITGSLVNIHHLIQLKERERGREEGVWEGERERQGRKENLKNVFFLVMRAFRIAWSLTAGSDGIHGDLKGGPAAPDIIQQRKAQLRPFYSEGTSHTAKYLHSFQSWEPWCFPWTPRQASEQGQHRLQTPASDPQMDSAWTQRSNHLKASTAQTKTSDLSRILKNPKGNKGTVISLST